MNAQLSDPSKPPTTIYNAFLLRCWFTDGAWRFALEDVQTHQRLGCDSLPLLLNSLQGQLAALSEGQEVE